MYAPLAAALTKGVVMEKTTVGNVLEFEAQVRKAISQAVAICQSRIEANNCKVTPELRVLSNTIVALDQAVIAFLAAEKLSK